MNEWDENWFRGQLSLIQSAIDGYFGKRPASTIATARAALARHLRAVRDRMSATERRRALIYLSYFHPHIA